MAVEQVVRSWSERFAARMRGEASAGLADILAMSGDTDLVSFAGGFPDPATFPGPELAEVLGAIIASGDASAFQYAPTPGLPGMRALVTARLAADGRAPQDDELVITSGAIEALELLGKTFLDAGDVVAVESPTYLGAIMAARGFEAEVAGVPMDGDGLDVDVLRDLLNGSRPPKLLYTIPDHQNPAGVSLSDERRAALVELARRHGLLIVEDVAYRELGFDGRKRPSLWSAAPDVVAQIGTFSKTFFPGVRLGWAAGPPQVIARLVLAKQNTDQCAGALGQRLLEEWARADRLDPSIAAARRLYARRWSLLGSALAERMPEGVTWTRPEGGFFTWLSLPAGTDSAALARSAIAAGVAVVPGGPFFPDGDGRGHLRLAFSRVDDDTIPGGVDRLAGAIASAASRD
ncbi:MAG TPA: PLP-dependent aminotransferase family protein [Actinomycetota bacterium]